MAAGQRGEKDPEAAVPFIKQNIEGQGGLNQAHAMIINRWLQYDPAAASKYVTTMPEGDARDYASAGIISHLLQNNADFDGAESWVKEVQNTELRQQMQQGLYYYWINEDRDTGLQKLKNSDLPEEKKTFILQNLGEG